jgi:hypothetical protein
MTNSGDGSPSERVVRWWKAVGVLSPVLALATVSAWVFLWTYFDYTRPHVADASAGRIYPLHTHGSIVYLTGQEEFVLDFLGWMIIPIFVIAVAIEVIFIRPLRRR